MARADLAARLKASLRRGAGVSSGPRIARAFHTWVALVFVVAFLSLGAQVDLLFGSHGLVPLEGAARGHAASWLAIPSWLRLGASDPILRLGVVVGVACGILAALGVAPRVLLAVATVDYLGYVVLGQPFLSFQWDNMIVETGFLAVFLPRRRAAPIVHALLLLLLFKLYWESGIAKWGSHLHDWHDGSAMTFYYETAPIPGPLAWWFHQLPTWWHHLESRTMLGVELVLPFLAFGPRAAKLLLLVTLTGFQLVNLATANYGFFVYLSLGLHLFLLEDADLIRAGAWIRERLGAPAAAPDDPPPLPRWRRRAGLAISSVLALYWVGFSILDGLATFTDSPSIRLKAGRYGRLYNRPRTVNTYHLFAHITRERIEPEFQVDEGQGFRPLTFHYKPGPVDRTPPLVAPHQPRVDFQLWFYGLSWRRGTPRYVWALSNALCRADPLAMELFLDGPTAPPRAARLVYWRYRFSTPAERQASGAIWTRTLVGETPPMGCAVLAAPVP